MAISTLPADRVTLSDPTSGIDRLNDRIDDHDARLDEVVHAVGAIAQQMTECFDAQRRATGPNDDFRRTSVEVADLKSRLARVEKQNAELAYDLAGAEHTAQCRADEMCDLRDRLDRAGDENAALRAAVNGLKNDLAAADYRAENNLDLAVANRDRLDRANADVDEVKVNLVDVRRTLADCARRIDVRDLRERVTVAELRLIGLINRLDGPDGGGSAGRSGRSPRRPGPDSAPERLRLPDSDDDCYAGYFIDLGEPVG